jgi:hypothetical protein
MTNSTLPSLRGNDDIRHAIQLLILTEESDQPIWNSFRHLSEIDPGLHLSVDDVVHHLRHLAGNEQPSDRDVVLWRELAAFSRASPAGETSRLIAAARPFATNRPELQTYLEGLTEPLPVPKWEIDRAARLQGKVAERDADITRQRREFAEHEIELRAGELRWVFPPAQAYLGLYSDIASELSPPERIGDWLGSELQAAALAGFEAVLRRPDLPTLEQVCESYAESRRWNFVLPMIAAVAERVRTQRGLGDLPPDLLATALVGFLNEHLDSRMADRALIDVLEATLRTESEHFERYARLLIEPSLARGVEHITGLYAFARSTLDQDLAVHLAAEWLERYPDLPNRIETELTDILLRAGDGSTLRRLYPSKLGRGRGNDEYTRT